MDVRCDRCQTEYELDDGSVAEGGASVQCTSCGHTFVVSRPTGTTPTPTPSPAVDAGQPSWMLTTAEGKTHRFKDPTTLQKWIVERRVARTDKVCAPGGSWRRLSEMDELRPFFEVVDQADRAAARGSRPTQPETPSRRTPGEAYVSHDDDDDDVLTSGRRSAGAMRAGGRMGGMSARLDSELNAGLDLDEGPSLELPVRRTGPKVFIGVLVVGAAIAGGAYLGWGSRRGPETKDLSAAAKANPGAAPAPSPAAPVAAAPPSVAPRAASVPAAPAASPAVVPSAPVAAPVPPLAPRPEAAPAAPAHPSPAVPSAGKSAAPRGEPPGAEESATAGRRAAERPHSYEQLVADGDRALENGNTAKAQKMFDEALKLQPDGVAAVTGSGYLLLDRQRPLAAIGMFKRALANAPAFPQALFGLGEAYRAQGDPTQAIEVYKRYLAVAPSGPDAPAARRQVRELESQAAPARRSPPAAPDETPAPSPTAPPPAN